MSSWLQYARFVETMPPSAKVVRLRYRNGKRTVIDGPFTESKELVGGSLNDKTTQLRS